MKSTSSAGVARRPHALVALALAGATAFAGLPGAAAAQAPLQTVIVTAVDGAGAAASAVRAVGGQVLDALPLIGGVSARLPRGAHLAPAYLVVANRPVGLSGSTGTSSGPATTVRETLGLGAPAGEGAGTTVAVVDTGVADVPDLAGRLTHVDVTGDGADDGYGHGTFVAGLVAGAGTGVAPGADVLDVRVAHADGTTDLVTVLEGLQQVARHPEVDVVNLSLSSGSPLPYQLDPLTMALESLWRRGVTVVVPAGNDGTSGPGSITSPGIDPVLLTVGGLDEHATGARTDDTVAAWSSQGPAPQGVAKPDLVAPGSHLVSLRAPGSTVDQAYPDARVGDRWFRGSGTSFSTAVTSGATAVLLAARPGLKPGQVKALMTGTAYEVPGASTVVGAGGLDLATALTTTAPSSKAGHLPGTEVALPGQPRLWLAFLAALENGTAEQAASSWSQLSPEARQWAARQWAGLTLEARQWAARQWAARQWADGDGTAEQWAARQWAARQWAARQWADSDWTARQWSARQWSADGWTARQWSADDWTARQWSARQWSARQWSTAVWQ